VNWRWELEVILGGVQWKCAWDECMGVNGRFTYEVRIRGVNGRCELEVGMGGGYGGLYGGVDTKM